MLVSQLLSDAESFRCFTVVTCCYVFCLSSVVFFLFVFFLGSRDDPHQTFYRVEAMLKLEGKFLYSEPFWCKIRTEFSTLFFWCFQMGI